MIFASEFENPFNWETPDMTTIDLGFGLFFIILGLIIIVIGLISIKADKIIAPMRYRIRILEKGTGGFWVYIAMELFIGLFIFAFGLYMIFFKN